MGNPNPHEDAARLLADMTATPRQRVEASVAELLERSGKQLADCVDLLDVNLRARLDGEHECEAVIPLLVKLGPALFPVCTFFVGLVSHLVTEVVAMHEATGSAAGGTIADDIILSARRAAAMQLDGMESALRRQVDERFRGRP